ncbi:MAG: ABC transporter permease [Lachnospira sp.]|nr:ABC transporter permease [Lachnospira sp.]
MQVFKAFYKCVLRRISVVIIYVSIFAAICIIMAQTANINKTYDFKAEQLKIAVFDYDNTPESNALYDYIADTQQLINISDDKESIADELFFRNIDYVLIIPQGFSSDYTSLENVKQAGSTSAYYMDNIINTYLKIFSTYTSAGYSANEAKQLTKQSLAAGSSAEILNNENEADDLVVSTYMKSFFQYLPYIFIAVIMTSMGGILIIFREKNINFRMKCSALSVTRRNAELSSACISYSLLLWCIFMVLAAIIYKQHIFTINGAMFVLNSLVFLLVAVSITYLVSLFAKNDNTMNVWSNILGLGMSFICGIFIPAELLSSGVATVSQFLPASWYIKALKICSSYNNNGADLKKYFGYLGIQLLFTIACFSAALVVSKYRKEEA